MKGLIIVFLLLILGGTAQAQLGTRPFDPALYGSDFTIDSSRCGLYIANQWIMPTTTCEQDQLPQLDSVLAFLAGFTCSAFMQTMAPQHCILEFNVNEKGNVTAVRASNARDGLLEYEVSEYWKQMPQWIPGTCQEQPTIFRLLYTLYYYPGR